MPDTSIAALPQNMLPIENISKREVPKRRLSDAAKAQTIVASLWQAATERNLRNAAIKGQIDGNPPYSPTKLRAAGRASNANFNTLEAKSLLSSALVPYYDLFAGGNRYIDIRCDYGNETIKSRCSGILSEEFDRLLNGWRDFEYVMHSMLTDFVLFGKGYLAWDDMYSWKFSKIAQYRVLVPDATTINLSDQELLVVLQDWPVEKLYARIRDREAATRAGWNVDETLDAIASAVPVDPAVPNDPLAAQQLLKDSDIYVSARSSTVQTATIFVREFNGKWSELMVRRDQIPGSGNYNQQQDPPPLRFMFQGYDRYSRFQQLINPFFFEVLDGSWNGASGLGRDIFAIMQLKDRLACSQADSAFLRSSIVVQPRQALDKTRMQLMQIGPMTFIPDGLEVLQSTILGDIETPILVSRELSMQTERNTGIYRPTLEKTKGNPETLGEFQMKFAQATVLSTSAINRFYSQLDRTYEEMFERVIKAGGRESGDGDASWKKEAREFKNRCYERGVPKEAFEMIESVRAWRNIGQGSAAMRQQTLQGLLGIYQLLPADGQQNLIEDVIAASSSRNIVERYMPEAARQQLPTDDMAFALLENSAMKQNAPVTWTPSQNNIIHAQTHLQAGAQAAQSLEQGANPEEVFAFLNNIGGHVTIHLQHEAQIPTSKEVVKVLQQQLDELAAITDQIGQQLQQRAEEQQQLQQQQQQTLTELDIKRMDSEGKLQISREKAQGTLQLKQARQEADLALKAQKQAVDNSLADASTAAEIARQTAKTQHEMNIAKTQKAEPGV